MGGGCVNGIVGMWGVGVQMGGFGHWGGLVCKCRGCMNVGWACKWGVGEQKGLVNTWGGCVQM